MRSVLFALILIFLGVWKWKASVVAFSTTDGKTRLTVGGSNPAVEKTLQEWVVQELDVRPV